MTNYSHFVLYRPAHNLRYVASCTSPLGANFCYRYLFYDTWNILDTLTIVVVAVAFLFRIMALDDGWSAKDEELVGTGVSPHDNFFMAQFFLALSAPLLFARVLFLSQIDDTLGPMTQVSSDLPRPCDSPKPVIIFTCINVSTTLL